LKLLADHPLPTLAIAMVIFLAAASSLRAYAGGASIGLLLLSLFLYGVGNVLMVPLMKANGMAVAMSVSAVLQLLLSTMVAVTAFGERPFTVQWAGIALGVIAVVLILWPQLAQTQSGATP
jgi:small multidrug resistance pump